MYHAITTLIEDANDGVCVGVSDIFVFLGLNRDLEKINHKSQSL